MRTAPRDDVLRTTPEGMLTLVECSRVAKVSTMTVTRWIQRGDLPAIRQEAAGRYHWRYLVGSVDLDNYLARKKADLNLNAKTCPCGHSNSDHATMFGRCSGLDSEGDLCPCSGTDVTA